MKKTKLNSYIFPLILLAGIIAGGVIGKMFGEKAKVLKPLGDIFINGMFTLVVPLVFTTISSSIASMNNLKRLGGILKYLVLTFVVTGLIASLLIIVVVKFYPPVLEPINSIAADVVHKKISVSEKIVEAITVTDFVNILSRKNILPLILFSAFFGYCVNLVGEKGRVIAHGLTVLSEVFLKMIEILILYAPIGLGAYFATLVGTYGTNIASMYGRILTIYMPLCIFYILIMFPIYAYVAAGKEGVFALKELFPSAITSLATQSSLATLPVNLETSEKIGVSKDIREIVLPIGATAHMDGTCISSILKISFLFGVYGIPFEGIETYIVALLLSLMGGLVMSGIPGGGAIGEMLIVSMYGFPPEALILITTIGIIIDAPATMLNATGDNIAAMLVSRFVEGKDWMRKNKKEEVEN